MKLNFIIIFQSLICSLVALTLPQLEAIYNSDAVVATDQTEFLEEIFTDEQLGVLQEFQEQIHRSLYVKGGNLESRDLESTIESVLNLVNRSGIIWDVLDYGVDHPNLVDTIANMTANLIGGSSSSNSSAITSFLMGTVSAVNATAVGNIVLSSGLIQSVLDGLLLDEEYRPYVSKIIYQVVDNNIGLITILLRGFLAPANSNSKRDVGSSLIEFVGNIVGSFLDSKVFYSGLTSVVNALNDTGFVVDTIHGFISNEEYVNMTGHLINEVIQKSDFNLTSVTSSINITSIVESVLLDTTSITDIIGSLLSGDLSGVSNLLKRYTPGIKAIIRDLEEMGLFTKLNNAIFPQSSSTSADAKALETGTSESQKLNDDTTLTSSDLGSNIRLSTPMGGFMILQTLLATFLFV